MAAGVAAVKREADMDDQCSPSFYSSCMHRHIEVVTSGSRNFYAGEVWDNYGEQVFCLDCQCTLSELDVREAWAGRGSSIRVPREEI